MTRMQIFTRTNAEAVVEFSRNAPFFLARVLIQESLVEIVLSGIRLPVNAANVLVLHTSQTIG